MLADFSFDFGTLPDLMQRLGLTLKGVAVAVGIFLAVYGVWRIILAIASRPKK